MAMRNTSRTIAASIAKNSISPIRSSAIVTIIAAPAGGFFLWLDVSAYGGSEAVTQRLWREAGLRVVPGRYLAREQADGSNPGADYVRVAMVQDKAITAETLHRLVAVLG
jgi:aspartate/methionine/tyrosine aminotransferase